MVRLKHRYIVVEINHKDQSRKDILQPFILQQNTLNQTIQRKVNQLHGDFGSAAIQYGFMTKYINSHTRIAVIRCRHGPHKLVTSTIPFIKELDLFQVAINILYIGATIKKCFNFIKMYQQKKCDEYCAIFNSEEDIKHLKNVLLNFDSVISPDVL